MTKSLKVLGIVLALLLGVVAFSQKALAQEELNIYFFHSNTCPHCIKEKAFLETLDDKYPSLNIEMYEISTSRKNLALFSAVGKELNVDITGVPFLLIGEEPIVGYQTDETTGAAIENAIKKAFESQPRDVVKEILESNVSTDNTDDPSKNKSDGGTDIHVPLIGTLNTADVSLPVLTFVIGLLDGFNPCAMWVLLFLISLLLGMNDRKKMWILGGTFIFSSGFVYFLFMSAWLNFFLFLGYSTLVRYGIGLLALGIGAHYLRDYWKNRGGCVTMENEKRKKIFERIKGITQKEKLLVAVAGMVLLAFAVNVVELLCSAGLPAVYTKVLTMSSLPSWQYYAYLFFYIIVFMLDDIIVFVIAMKTLEMVGIEKKYAQYSHLFGGLIMFLIGLLMTFKPELLMFS